MVSSLEDYKERIQCDFLLLVAQPRLEFLRQKSGYDFEVAISGAELKIQRNMELALSSADRAKLGRIPLESVKALEKFLV